MVILVTDFNCDLNQVFFVSKMVQFKSQLPPDFEMPRMQEMFNTVTVYWTSVRVGVSVFEEEDEPLVDAALAGDVFTFIRHCIIANADFHREVGGFCV